MNRLIMHLRVVLGITLILNLAVGQTILAEPGPDEPPPAEPRDAASSFVALQEGVFGYLFDADYGQGDPCAYRVLNGSGYYLPITGTGPYTGRIWTNQGFSFNCTTYVPVSQDFSELPPQQRPPEDLIRKAVNESWQVSTVAGIVATTRAQLPILGFAFSGVPAELGQYVSYFVVVHVLSPDDPLIVGTEPLEMRAGGVGTVIDDDQEQTQVPEVPDSPISHRCEGCYSTYRGDATMARDVRDCAFQSAENTYASKLAASDRAWANDRDAAYAAYESAGHIANGGLVIGLAGCTLGMAIPLFGPLQSIACAAGFFVAYAAALAVAGVARQNALAAANARRIAALAAAQAARTNEILDAECAYDTAMSAAGRALDHCLIINECR